LVEESQGGHDGPNYEEELNRIFGFVARKWENPSEAPKHEVQ
jgi:hypothetical protein